MPRTRAEEYMATQVASLPAEEDPRWDEFNRQELEKELRREDSLQFVKPNRMNEGENRQIREILLEEQAKIGKPSGAGKGSNSNLDALERDLSTDEVPTVSGKSGGSSLDLLEMELSGGGGVASPKEDHLSLMEKELPSLSGTGTDEAGIKGVASDFVTGLAQLKRAVVTPAALVANKASEALGGDPGKFDQVIANQDKDVQDAHGWLLTPGEQARRGMISRIAGGIAGAVPYMAMGVPGMVAGGYSTGANASLDAVKGGAEPVAAYQVGAAQGLAFYLGLKIPAVVGGKNILPSVALGGVTNPLTGAVGDLASQEVLKRSDAPQLAKDYDPLDVEKRGVEAGVGAVLSGVFKGAQLRKTRIYDQAVEKQNKILQKDTDALISELDRTISDASLAREVYKPTPTDNFETLVQGSGRERADKYLDYSIEHLKDAIRIDPLKEAALSPLIKRAEQLQKITTHLGLNDIIVERDPRLRFQYDPSTDIINLQAWDPRYQGKIDKYAEGFIHEMEHGLTSRTMQWYDDIKAKNTSFSTDPVKKQMESKLFDSIERQEELLKILQTQMAAKENMPVADLLDTLRTIQDNRRQGIPFANAWEKFVHENYNFIRNLHEFNADVGNGVVADTILKNTPLFEGQFRPHDASNVEQKNITSAYWDEVLGARKDKKTWTMYDAAIHSQARVLADIDKVGTRHMERASDNFVFDKSNDDFRKNQVRGLHSELQANKKLDYIYSRIRGNLLEASSADEFKTKMLFEFPTSDSWNQWIEMRADLIYKNSARVLDAIPTPKKTGNNYFEQENRTTVEFLHDEIKNTKLSGADDLGLSGNLRFAFGGDQANLLIGKKKAMVNRVFNHLLNKSQQKATFEEILFHDAKQKAKAYFDASIADQLVVARQRTYWDQNSHLLVRQGLQWPTRDMLRLNNLTEPQIDAYIGLTKALDAGYNLLEQARKKQDPNGPPLPRRPGYMEHIWPDPYKVLLKATYTDKNGHLKQFTIRTQGFKTGWAAERWLKRHFENNTDLASQFKAMGLNPNKYPNVTKVEPDIDPQSKKAVRVVRNMDLSQLGLQALLDEVGHYHKAFGLENADTLKTVQKLDDDVMRGMSKHTLVSDNVTGYLNEKGPVKSLYEKIGVHLGIGTNAKIIASPEAYLKSVTEYWKNTMFLADDYAPLMKMTQSDTIAELGTIGKPLFGNYLEGVPEAQKWLQEVGMNITGANPNELRAIDNTIQRISIWAKIDPYLYKDTVRALRNALSTIAVRTPYNFIANSYQMLNTKATMDFVNAQMRAEGITNKNISTAAIMAKILAPNAVMTPGRYAAVKWAEERRILEPQMEAQARVGTQTKIDKYLLAGQVNPAIEKVGRQQSFLMGYEMGMKVFNGDEIKARWMGKKIMDLTMVNYDRSNRPLMYQNFGIVGESASPFAVFRNAYVGNTIAMIKMALDNPKHLWAYKPALTQMLVGLGTAGAMGLPIVSEWNQIAELWNSLFPSENPVKTWEETLLTHKVPKAAVWGVVSWSTQYWPGLENGINLSSSMNAPGLADLAAAPLLPFTASIAKIGWELRDFDVNWRNLYGPVSQIVPRPVGKYVWEQRFTDPTMRPMGLDAKGQGEVYREPADERAYFLTGRHSLREADERARNRIEKERELFKKERITKLVQKLADDFMRHKVDADHSDIYREAERLDVTQEELRSKAAQILQRNQTTHRERQFKKRDAVLDRLRRELDSGMEED